MTDSIILYDLYKEQNKSIKEMKEEIESLNKTKTYLIKKLINIENTFLVLIKELNKSDNKIDAHDFYHENIVIKDIELRKELNI